MSKLYLIGFAVLLSCQSLPNNSNRTLSNKEKTDIQNLKLIDPQEGSKGLRANCYACHNPDSESHDKMLAPPLAGIKYRYKKMYPEEELFIAQMADYIDNPSKENALMKGPIKRFGLMPKTTLSKNEIQELVKYIYNNELEFPQWFPEHFEERHNIEWKENTDQSNN